MNAPEKNGATRTNQSSIWPGTGPFIGWIGNTQVTWFHYPNPVLEPFTEPPDVPGLRIASLKDVAIMKWTALANRGSIKDFIDLFVPDQQGITLKDLFPLLEKSPPMPASIPTVW